MEPEVPVKGQERNTPQGSSSSYPDICYEYLSTPLIPMYRPRADDEHILVGQKSTRETMNKLGGVGRTVCSKRLGRFGFQKSP